MVPRVPFVDYGELTPFTDSKRLDLPVLVSDRSLFMAGVSRKTLWGALKCFQLKTQGVSQKFQSVMGGGGKIHKISGYSETQKSPKKNLEKSSELFSKITLRKVRLQNNLVQFLNN